MTISGIRRTIADGMMWDRFGEREADMNESNPAPNKPLREKPKRERRFCRKQYEILMRCSVKKDITEWNEWRGMHSRLGVFLEGADLTKAYLVEANLRYVNLRDANLWKTHLDAAELWGVHLEGAELLDARLECAELWGAHLEGANLEYAHLQNANLWDGRLQGCRFRRAHLEGATFHCSHCEGADFSLAHLQRSCFRAATVSGDTCIWSCQIDERTDFTGVALDTARVEPGLKELLAYNVRRKGWERWYGKHRWGKYFVGGFWLISDYGRSTGRIIKSFFLLSFCFALVYWLAGLLFAPGGVANLFEAGEPAEPIAGWMVPLRAIYFSIVTMTTLGFGDMYARTESICGHVLLMAQVLLGYVLLGALVTRFAVLFTSGGPAANHLMAERKTSGQWFRQMMRIDRRKILRRVRQLTRF